MGKAEKRRTETRKRTSDDRRQKSENRKQKSDNPIRKVDDLKIYKLAYELAMKIFEISKEFPKEETYSLTGQIRRSSRSVAINIREGFAKRRYENVFIRHLNDAFGSSEETRGWLCFAEDCRYITSEKHMSLDERYDELNAMIFSLMTGWQKYSDF